MLARRCRYRWSRVARGVAGLLALRSSTAAFCSACGSSCGNPLFAGFDADLLFCRQNESTAPHTERARVPLLLPSLCADALPPCVLLLLLAASFAPPLLSFCGDELVRRKGEKSTFSFLLRPSLLFAFDLQTPFEAFRLPLSAFEPRLLLLSSSELLLLLLSFS